MTDIVSARIDEDTRRRMKRLPHINWSQIIREAITEKIHEEERRPPVDPKELREASEIADSVRAPSPGWDSTEEIRRWRERR